MADQSKKQCFVVGPIGAPDSEVRIHADWFLEEIVEPVMQGHPEFLVHRADKLSDPGMIDTQVITHLLNDDLVIADITTLNPNAFYEIGIRHMAQKPIVHMHKVGEKIPFDIGAYRSISFSTTKPSDLRAARKALKDAVAAVFAEGYRVNNPVTHARGLVQLQRDATEPQRVILDELEAVKERLAKFERETGNFLVVDPATNIVTSTGEPELQVAHFVPKRLVIDANRGLHYRGLLDQPRRSVVDPQEVRPFKVPSRTLNLKPKDKKS